MPKILYILLLVNVVGACNSGAETGRAKQADGQPEKAREQSLQHEAALRNGGISTNSEGLQNVSDTPEGQTSRSAESAGSEDLPKEQKEPIPPINQHSSGSTRPVESIRSAEETSGKTPEPGVSQNTPRVLTKLDALFNDMNQFFLESVNGGLVRYGRIAAEPTNLNDLVSRIASTDLTDAGEPQQKAFRINAYNILVIKQVVDHYPVNSPMDIAGFFDNHKHRVAGELMTLNELEAGLRSDPRIHFALVCAAMGCPKIQPLAYRPATLDDQLTASTHRALNDPGFIRFSKGDQRAELSQIFDWYAADFGGADALLDYINRYRNVPIPEGTPIDFYTYSWKLNKANG